MGLPDYILNQFPSEIQPPMQLLCDWILENSGKNEDFTSLIEGEEDPMISSEWFDCSSKPEEK